MKRSAKRTFMERIATAMQFKFFAASIGCFFVSIVYGEIIFVVTLYVVYLSIELVIYWPLCVYYFRYIEINEDEIIVVVHCYNSHHATIKKKISDVNIAIVKLPNNPYGMAKFVISDSETAEVLAQQYNIVDYSTEDFLKIQNYFLSRKKAI